MFYAFENYEWTIISFTLTVDLHAFTHCIAFYEELVGCLKDQPM